jgi:hypothetical protein
MNRTLDSHRTARTAAESVPTEWTAADEAFFRLVGEALPAAYLLGASVLLASYDPEPAAPAATTPPYAARGRRPVTGIAA